MDLSRAIPSWASIVHWGPLMKHRSYTTNPTRASRTRRTLGALALVVASLGVIASPALAGSTNGAGSTPSWVNGFWHHHGAHGESDVNVCSYAVAPGSVHCNAQIVTDLGSNALAAAPVQPSGSGSSCNSSDTNVPTEVSTSGTGAYDPCYLDSAYNVAAAAASHGAGAGQIVAIVDAYSDPNVTSNLASYRSFFGLSACPTGTVSPSNSTCTFEVVNQNGSTSSLPSANASWGEEISLDVEMVSAICQDCQILLVEASSSTMANLGTGVNTAVALGANVVSNSYGGSEYSSEVSDSLNYYDHPGVAVVVASGDGGYGTEFPAASPYVTAVGGTSLFQSTDGGTRTAATTESVWSGAGAGCSAYEPKPTWQKDPSCANRMVTDVSAIADPSTGVWVYDTYGTGFTWGAFGGTSVATPIISSMYALAGNAHSTTGVPASSLYANTGSLYQVTSGSDGTCPSSTLYFCNAADSVNGYNGPSGLGTPGGSPSSIAAFSTVSAPPTAPGAPTLNSASGGNGTVTLSWSAPTSNGGSALTGYDVYEGASATSISTEVASVAASTTSTTLSGLTNGDTYYFDVEAVNAVNNSTASNSLFATPAVLSAPGAPTLNSATASSGAVALGWSAPTSNGGSAITGYDVYEGASATSISTEVASVSASTTSTTLSGLTNGDTYYFDVEAVNAVNNSAASNSLSATPVASAVPGAPTLNSAQPGRRQITLSYTAPTSNGGSSITGYYIYIGTTASGVSSTPLNSTPLNYTRVTVTGLTRGATYYFVVRAANKNGVGAASNELSATSD
jgi:subtilase family serine protease